jgi:toxin ParE1/3/4
MGQAIWSELAELDLEEIVYYIAVEDKRPQVAEQIAGEIRDACDRYAEHPLVGEREPRLGGSCRRFTHKRWVILYRPEETGISVIRVVDGARDFDRLFGSK